MRLLFCEMEEVYLKSLAFVRPYSLVQTGLKGVVNPMKGHSRVTKTSSVIR